MNLNLSNTEFSRNDFRNKVNIPIGLTPQLAEFLGIMIGDGHIEDRKRKDRNSENVYEMQITGNIIDKNYYTKYVNPLIKRLFNVKFKIIERKSSNSLVLFKNSKAIHSFLKNEIGLIARKHNVRIPKIIMKSHLDSKAAFLKGLFDADFCLVIKYKPNAYPVVQGCAKSDLLIRDVEVLLNQLGINSCTFKEEIFDKRTNRVYSRQCIYINGRKRVEKYMKRIGFSNENKVEKYRKFMKNEP